MGNNKVANPFPIKAVTEMIHRAVLDERSRWMRGIAEVADLARKGELKLQFGMEEALGPLEYGGRVADYIATSMEVQNDCRCDGCKEPQV